jgi:hypothetical protein
MAHMRYFSFSFGLNGVNKETFIPGTLNPNICTKKDKLRGFWSASGAGQRFLVPNLRIEGCHVSARRFPTAVNLGFLDRSRYIFFQVASNLSSQD